ncbi:MAG TPA: dTDP-4-dehydrorhamnose 3,5-epimerase [Caulobacteraceae bacterium]|nr:dTDP-4-dehydrorhamnose 3,5-epimerase [Caulobacteraceae bacterium]
MEVERLAIPEVLRVRPRRIGDARGHFTETYRRDRLEAAGIACPFVQDNLSYSAAAGVLRGLHYQRPPHAQAKLVSVLDGRILDVVVDVRRGSPTFGEHLTVEMSAKDGAQLFVPEGFLHGFVTLTPDTRVAYKVSDYYAADCDAAVRWDDPDLGINWGVSAPTLSAKDAAAPLFAQFDTPFTYDARASR